MKTKQIYNWLDQRIGEDPSFSVCKSILDFLTENFAQNLEMLTLANLAHIGKTDPISDDFLKALVLLSGSELNVLEKKFSIFDGNIELRLDDDEIVEFISTNSVVHPDSGEIINNEDVDIVPYFKPTEEFLDGQE